MTIKKSFRKVTLAGFAFFAIAALGVTAWVLVQSSAPKARQISSVANSHSMVQQPPVEQGEVWGPDQEQMANQILEQTENIVDQNHLPGQPAHRDAHPKAHACVKADLAVQNANLSPMQQVGVFSADQNLQAWVRFSNGAPDGFNKPDSDSDIRGMAVKLMTSEGSQDFVMINSPRFFSRDAEDYNNLFQALNKGGFSLITYFLENITNGLIIKRAQVQIHSVLATTYFSPVPLKLGSQSMRLKMEPCDSNSALVQPTDETHPNFLRESLLTSLSAGPACFHFYVQPNQDPQKNKIEDPTLEWDEKKSPFLMVGNLSLPQQSDFATEPRMNFCENLSFNPWHTRPETRPMGQINRTRLIVYGAISAYRHGLNKTPVLEPTDQSACEGSAAALCQGFH